MNGRRSILLLQGPAGACFARLAEALETAGHAVHKVHFNLGDRVFWRGSAASAYRGRAVAWPVHCARLIRRLAITDIVVFGDCRPLHRAAIKVARRLGVRVMVAEEGYARPDWITFEEHGVNGFSTLPRDPGWYIEQAARLLPAPAPPSVRYSFGRRAVEDVLYNLSAIAGRLAYPFYRTHRPWHPLLEYAGWAWQLASRGRAGRRTAAAEARLVGATRRYFLFPLQLDCDSQLRVHSPFASQDLAIARVLGSFARAAPAGCLLVVKQHPLENGLRDWRGRVGEAATRAGIADRVVFLEAGTLATLAGGALGMVTINSTCGMAALEQGVPVLALGTAIYDLPGLTDGGTMDGFWQAPAPPDPTLFRAFRAVLIDRCLLPGGFYSDQGLDLLVEGAVARLEQSPAMRRGTGLARSRGRVAAAVRCGMAADGALVEA